MNRFKQEQQLVQTVTNSWRCAWGRACMGFVLHTQAGSILCVPMPLVSSSASALAHALTIFERGLPFFRLKTFAM